MQKSPTKDVDVATADLEWMYGVATISRLLKITGHFCKRALQKRRCCDCRSRVNILMLRFTVDLESHYETEVYSKSLCRCWAFQLESHEISRFTVDLEWMYMWRFTVDFESHCEPEGYSTSLCRCWASQLALESHEILRFTVDFETFRILRFTVDFESHLHTEVYSKSLCRCWAFEVISRSAVILDLEVIVESYYIFRFTLDSESFRLKRLIDRSSPPREGFLFTMFPYQEPRGRGPPSKHLVQIPRGGSSCSGMLMREHSK